MAGVIDALTWAMKSGPGVHLGRWVAGKRGLRRVHGVTGVFYTLY